MVKEIEEFLSSDIRATEGRGKTVVCRNRRYMVFTGHGRPGVFVFRYETNEGQKRLILINKKFHTLKGHRRVELPSEDSTLQALLGDLLFLGANSL